MRLVLQRVTKAACEVDGETIGKIGLGLVVLAGFGAEDCEDGAAAPGGALWKKMLNKICDLRIFADDKERMNLSLRDVSGDLLVISQFTLHADCRKGRRPSFIQAAPPDQAQSLYHRLVTDLKSMAPARVASGEFGAEMHIDMTNWGPVTIVLDSEEL